MTQPGQLDETDSRLLHALQIEPRASWQELAPVVGADAATLARRWSRLRGEGIAWSTGYRPPGQMALLELECEHGRLQAVAEGLRADREAIVVDYSSGSRDLLVLAQADDLASMSQYSVDRLGDVPGIRAVRTHLINELLIEAVSWRLRSLTPAEVHRIPPPRPPRPRAAKTVPQDLEAALDEELASDGRAGVGAIAARTGFAPQRVSDAIATLRAQGRLRFRTDIARTYSEWPVYAWYFIEAPGKVVEMLRKQVTTIPEVRLAATTASRYNVILAVWLRRLSDVNRLEIALAEMFAGARIADRSVVMRIDKHLGRVIGPDGRAVGLAEDRA
ncbi:Lrp/AsnC family transcriptional regulator [Propionicimonas sp.]|uniref:Lrp/AsnC family transcriptional regulator n=1 Tax=Propionicimonas sp. TaxID=1955623 RepID=UPI0039E4C5CD